jgi:PAS domain S-box-containing protein
MSMYTMQIATLLLALLLPASAPLHADIAADAALPAWIAALGSALAAAAIFRRTNGTPPGPGAPGPAGGARGHLRLVRQPICVFDRGSRVTEFSESFALLWATRYGMRPAEGVGLQAMFPSAAQEGERSGWQDRLARAFRGEQFTRDLQVREGNAVRTYDVTYTPVRRGPEVVSVIVTMEDVTRALAAERALVASEERYEAFAGQSTEAIWRIDLTPGVPVTLDHAQQVELFLARARIAECNEAAAHAFGLARADLVVGRRASTVMRLDRPEGAGFLARLVQAGYRLLDVETTAQAPGGSTLHYLNNFAGVVRDGSLVRIWAMARDVTERFRAEEALRLRGEVYRTVVDTTGEWVWEADLEGRLLFSNNAVADILGVPPDEAVGTSRSEFIDPADRSAMTDLLRAGVEGGKGWRNEIIRARHRDGSLRYLESSCAPVMDGAGTLVRLRGTDRDITDRKRAEDSLRESREWLAAMFEASRDGIMVEENGVVVYANGSYARMLGYARPEEVFFKNVGELCHPDDLARLAQQSARQDRGDEPHSVFEFRGRRIDGSDIELEASVAGAEVLGKRFVVSTVREIADRKAAEEALRWQKVYFEQLFESAPEGVAILDKDDRVLRANEEFARMFGYGPEEVTGRCIPELIAPDGREGEVARLTGEVNAGRQVSIETVRRRKDGSLLEVSILGTPLRGRNGETTVYGVYRDISERKRAERLRSALYRIAQITGTTGDLAEFFAELHRIIGELMEARNLSIAEHLEASGEVRYVFWSDESESCPPPRSGARGISEYVLRTGAPLLATRAVLESLAASGEIALDVRTPAAWLGVPLRYRDRTYGVLAVRSYTSEGAFGERDKELLTFVSQHIAAALLSKQAEEALRRSEAEARKLALVASRTDNAVIISDAEGVIEWVNDGFVRLTGYQPEEVVGRRPGAFLQGSDTDYGTVRRMKEALVRREGFHEEVLNYARDGRPYWVDIEVQPIRDGQGAVMNFMAIERDITDRKRIEQERQKFVSLVENSSDLIVMTSTQGEILYLNDAGRRLVGIQGSPASVRFRIEDFLDQENLPAFRDTIAPAVLSTGRWEGEIQIVRASTGETVPITGNAFVVRDPDTGAPICFAAILRDITERRKSEEDMRYQKRFVRQVIDTDPNLIYVKDEEGRFLFVNQALADFFGSTIEKIVAAQSPDLPPHLERLGGHPGAEQEVVRTMRELVFEEAYRVRDGATTTFLTILKPLLLSDGVPRVLGISMNITQRKHAEEELVKAKEAAESANRLKGEFLANMSHEIRTPMNGILGMTQLALETDLTAEQREYLELVRSSGDSLLRIINDILDFSKIEARKLDLEQSMFSVRDLVRDVVRLMTVPVREKDLTVETLIDDAVPASAVGDQARLRQILVNLVGNAVKFTERGTITVRCGVAPDEDAPPAGTGGILLRWTVSDTGIGIPSDKQEIIFDPFTQVDGSATRRFGGTGLGLSITAQLVALMGGRIRVESSVGSGSSFHFTVRLALAPEGEAAGSPLEDVRAYLIGPASATVAAAVVAAGAGCETFPTLAECLSAIENSPPARTGLPLVVAESASEAAEAARALQSRRNGVRPSIVVVLPEGTALTDTQGADALLSLPVAPPVVLDLLATLADDSLRVAEDSPSLPGRPLAILVAEDNPLNRRLLHRMLERHGHAVTLAANGAEAVARVQEKEFDLILMDIQMPEMDGFEATRRVRETEAGTGRRTPIVAVTAHAMLGFRERALGAGMDDYISKPVLPAELSAALARIGSAERPARDEEPPVAAPGGVFDERKTLERLDGDVELLAQIMEIFVESFPAQMSDLRDALNRGDTDAIARSAHALRGALSNFSAPEAYEVVQRLEQAGRAGRLSDVGEVFRQLEGVVQRLTRAFERFRRGTPQEAKQRRDTIDRE